MVLDPETEVSRDEFETVLDELMNALLRLTAATGPLLGGDEQESKAYERDIRSGRGICSCW